MNDMDVTYKCNLNFDLIYKSKVVSDKGYTDIYKKIITSLQSDSKCIIDGLFLKEKFKLKYKEVNEYAAECMNYIRTYLLITPNRIVGEVTDAHFNHDNELTIAYKLNYSDSELEQMIRKSEIILLPMCHFDELAYFIMLDISHF